MKKLIGRNSIIICYIITVIGVITLIGINHHREKEIIKVTTENEQLREQIELLEHDVEYERMEVDRWQMIADDYYWLFYYDHVSSYDGEYEYYE